MLLGMLKDLLKGAALSPGQRAEEERALKSGPTSPVAAMSAEEAECRRALELMPNFAEAHIRLGVVMKNARRLPEAEAAFRRALSLHGDNVVAHYNLGVVLAETNRPWEAEAAYRNALKLEPRFVEAHNNLGVVLQDTKRLTEAEAAFRRALELKPEFAEAKKNLGTVVAESKRLAEIEADLRHALEQTPDSAEAHNRLGIALKDARQLAQAEAAFRRAIELQPDYAVAHYNLGVVLAESHRPWDAEAGYRNAVRSEPRFAEAHNNLGVVLRDTKRLAEAEAAHRRALDLKPDFAEAHNNLGVVLRDAKRLPEAEAAFHRVIAINPHHEAARRNLDLVLKEIARLSEVEAADRHALELNPNSVAAQCKSGLTLMELGRLDEAVARFKQTLAIEPNHAEAHNYLGMALLRQKQTDEALACFLRATSLRPEFAKAMANLGAAYFMKKDFEQAAAWSQAALAIEPLQVEANQTMAFVLLEKGQRDEAKQHLDRASGRQSVTIEYATTPVRTVLLLWTRRQGNLPAIELLLPATINTRVNWVMGSAPDDQIDTLPDYDLVFNAMGDPDLIGDSAGPLTRFASTCAKPLLNHPDQVARTARHRLPALLDGIDNIVVPAIWRFASNGDWDESVVHQLPLLIRPVDSHGGTGLKLATTASELAQYRASQSGPVYACRFVDFRSADSFFRKCRIVFIDRKPYPVHLAISPNWMVHYASADMESFPWKIEEERWFLQDTEGFLGSAAMRAIESIGERMDLDYTGIDFSITADKRVLVFEANPMMLFHTEEISGPLKHKNQYIFRIQRDFEEFLQRICR